VETDIRKVHTRQYLVFSPSVVLGLVEPQVNPNRILTDS